MLSVDVVEVFLEGARVVTEALASSSVAAAWELPSVLEDQRVGGLAGHLARSGVMIVGEYLDVSTDGAAVDFSSAGDYFSTLLAAASADDHAAIRRRGADAAAAGHAQLCRTLEQRLDAVEPRLRSLDGSHLIAVTGRKVLRLDDYLTTRIVEQVVHLDDVARSVDHDPWPLPERATDLAIAVAIDIARRRAGSTAVLRALYRRGWSGPVFPAL